MSGARGQNTNGQLRAFFERVERLHEERHAIGDDIKEIFAEAKGNGFDTKVMKIVLQKRRMDGAARAEQDALVELYMRELGMVADDEPRAPARAREIIEQFDADTGEIIEPAGQTVEQGGEGGAALPADTHTQPEPREALRQIEAGQVAKAGDQSSGNVDGSAGRSHSARQLSTESPASVPLEPPAKKQWTQADHPHADCLDPGQCGGFSNLGLCVRCKEAAAGRIAA